MPYVTAGMAVGRLEANIAGIPLGRQSANNLGWTVGAGVEMVISGPWTVKLEFLHADLNGFSCDSLAETLRSSDSNGKHRFRRRQYQCQREHHSSRAQFSHLEQMIVFAGSEGTMKKLIIIGSAVLAACVAGPAIGADLPVETPVYVERPPAIGLLNWTGFYFGANLGYARSPGSMDIFVGGLPVLSLSDTMSGVIGGVEAGANWQTGNAVFGIEGDIQGTSQSVSSTITTTDVIGAIAFPGAAVTAANNDKITSFGTLRGRLGIASGRALYYVTGGGAFWTWSSNLTVTGLGSCELLEFSARRHDRRRCRVCDQPRLDRQGRIPVLAVHHHIERALRRPPGRARQHADPRQRLPRWHQLHVLHRIGRVQASCLLAQEHQQELFWLPPSH